VNDYADHELEDYAVVETSLYPRVETFLHLRFQERIKPLLGESIPPLIAITANASVAGQWTRPDLALVSLWRNRYSPALQLDVYGFEVKTRSGCNLAAVHEALAQNRVVQYSYLVWHVPEMDLQDQNFANIRDHCEAFRIGLITFSRGRDADSFIVHLKARRADPAPNAVDEFIEAAFSETDRERLLQFLPHLDHHETRCDR
jgi:hypothetical protein